MRKIRMGMVGGGRGAFIGAVHRIAAAIDQQIELVPEERCYANYEEMILTEKTLPEGERMDFVAIVTPNHMHFAPAKMALENGFHVLSDKPACFNTEQAEELEEVVVRGEKTQVEIKLDKRVYNVGKDLTALGGSVSPEEAVRSSSRI